jgi:uncharacterized protein DUF1524
VYPQGNLGNAWSGDLANWREKRDRMDARKYVLGNLTAVTNYDNQKNGTKAFAVKKLLIKNSAPLKLHDSIVSVARWMAAPVDKRTQSLAQAALAHWPGP